MAERKIHFFEKKKKYFRLMDGRNFQHALPKMLSNIVRVYLNESSNSWSFMFFLN